MYKPTNEMMTAVAELTNYEFREKYNQPLNFHIYLQDYPYSGKQGVFNLVLEDGTDGYVIYTKSFLETNNLILLVHYKDVFLEAIKDPFINYLVAGLGSLIKGTCESCEPCEQEFALLERMNESEYLKDDAALFDYVKEAFKGKEDVLVEWDYDDNYASLDVYYKDILIGFWFIVEDYLKKENVQHFLDDTTIELNNWVAENI
jgi:hypothetical protein